jgi:hypothetical protein
MNKRRCSKMKRSSDQQTGTTGIADTTIGENNPVLARGKVDNVLPDSWDGDYVTRWTIFSKDKAPLSTLRVPCPCQGLPLVVVTASGALLFPEDLQRD